LHRLPVAHHLFGAGYLDGPEDVRMPANKLFADALCDLTEVELTAGLGDACLHQYLQQQVAELLAQLRTGALIDRLENLISLLEQGGPEGGRSEERRVGKAWRLGSVTSA